MNPEPLQPSPAPEEASELSAEERALAQRLADLRGTRPSENYRRRAAALLQERIAFEHNPALAATDVLPPRRRARSPRGWAGAAVRLALVGAAIVLSLLSVGYVAAQSLPGEPLYPVKRQLEEAQVTLSSPASQDELRLSLADRRLAELQRQIERAAPLDRIVRAAVEYRSALAHIRDGADDQRLLAVHIGVLGVLSDVAAPEARPALAAAQDQARAAWLRAAPPGGGRTTPPDTATPHPPTVTAPTPAPLATARPRSTAPATRVPAAPTAVAPATPGSQAAPPTQPPPPTNPPTAAPQPDGAAGTEDRPTATRPPTPTEASPPTPTEVSAPGDPTQPPEPRPPEPHEPTSVPPPTVPPEQPPTVEPTQVPGEQRPTVPPEAPRTPEPSHIPETPPPTVPPPWPQPTVPPGPTQPPEPSHVPRPTVPPGPSRVPEATRPPERSLSPEPTTPPEPTRAA